MNTLSYNFHGQTYNFTAVKARAWECWNASLFSVPKISYICGSCGGANKQRPQRDRQTSAAVTGCQYCATVNIFPVGNGLMTLN